MPDSTNLALLMPHSSVVIEYRVEKKFLIGHLRKQNSRQGHLHRMCRKSSVFLSLMYQNFNSVSIIYPDIRVFCECNFSIFPFFFRQIDSTITLELYVPKASGLKH